VSTAGVRSSRPSSVPVILCDTEDSPPDAYFVVDVDPLFQLYHQRGCQLSSSPVFLYEPAYPLHMDPSLVVLLYPSPYLTGVIFRWCTMQDYKCRVSPEARSPSPFPFRSPAPAPPLFCPTPRECCLCGCLRILLGGRDCWFHVGGDASAKYRVCVPVATPAFLPLSFASSAAS